MFLFVVRHFRWLARVPGLPHLFEALLLTSTCLLHRARLLAMESLENEAQRCLGVALRSHRFGGTEFVEKNGRELGHLHGHGLLDVAVGRQAAGALLAAGKVRPHHVLPDSKWVSFHIETSADVPFALDLLRLAGTSR